MIPVIIPVRGIHLSKQRLRKKVGDEKVDLLVRALLDRAVDSLEDSAFSPVIVTSETSLKEELEGETMVFLDAGTSLNEAVEQVVSQLDSEIVGLLMPDLPGLTPHSIRKISSVHSVHRQLIVPTYDEGTAFALLHRSYWFMKFLGPRSSSRFVDYAEERREQLAVMIIQEMSHDIDTLDDLNKWGEVIRQI